MSDITFRSTSKVELVQSNASDNMVAMSAWVSNGLNQEERLWDQAKVKGLINFLYRERHMSPFEHGQFTFKIETPIFVAREFMRHRTFSFSEMSGRYMTMLPEFYLPDPERPIVQEGKIGAYNFVAGTNEQYAITRTAIERSSRAAWSEYESMKDYGIANEVARMVLPVNIFTQFYATVNPRNLMQFLDLRAEMQALKEIRDVAYSMESIFEKKMPMTHAAYKKGREK